jgi:hypothetical protein
MQDVAAYVFLCRDITHDECLERNLFGGQEKYYEKTGEIPEGAQLFLYNFSSHLLEGTFIATSKSDWNIVPEAWQKKYPWQISCKRVHTYPALMKSEIIPVFGNYGKYPKAQIEPEKLEKLLQLFHNKSLLSEEEKALRLQTPHVIYCTDGHRVRSTNEKIIDNWLYQARICHAYESELPFKEAEKNCDFVVHISGKEDIYIEYWGMNTNEYEQNRERKKALYKKYNLRLIEIFPKDIKNLDTILGSQLR